MADKELEQQNRTLKELVDNQKETNKTLVTGFSALQKSGAEDSTFMSKNLGSLMEVVATRAAVQTQIKHEKKEEMTEVDEKVEKLTEENVKEGKKSRNLLRTIADFSTKSYSKATVAASKATEMAREGSQKLRKLGDTIVKGVTKGFRETWGSMTKVAKKLTFAGVIFAAFMIAFMNFLGSDFFNKGFDILRNTIIPSIGKAWEIIKRIGTWIGGFFDPLIKDITNYMKSQDEWGIEGKIKKKTVVQIFIDNWKQILGGIGGLALLLVPGIVFKGLLKGSTWLILGTLGLAAKMLIGSFTALAGGITLMARSALGMPLAGSAAALAAASAAKIQVRAGATQGGARMSSTGQWKTGTQGGRLPGVSVGAAEQAKLTQKYQKAQAAKLPQGLPKRLATFKNAARGIGTFALPLILALEGYNAWNIFTNDKMSYEDKKKNLGNILFGSVGSLALMMIGGGIGAATGGPIGGIVGAVLGGMAGQKAGELLAGWLLGDDTAGVSLGKPNEYMPGFEDVARAKHEGKITGHDYSSYALADWEAGASWNMPGTIGMPLGKAKTYTSPTKEEMIRKALIRAVTPDFHTDTKSPKKFSYGAHLTDIIPVVDPLKETVIDLKDAIKEWIKELGEQKKRDEDMWKNPEYIKAYNEARSNVNLVDGRVSNINSGNSTTITAKPIVQPNPILRVVTTKSTGWLAGLGM